MCKMQSSAKDIFIGLVQQVYSECKAQDNYVEKAHAWSRLPPKYFYDLRPKTTLLLGQDGRRCTSNIQPRRLPGRL